MKKENPLLGIWLADLTRWSVDAGNIAPVVWLTLGRLRVEFQEKNMSIQNYGVRPTTNAVYRFIDSVGDTLRIKAISERRKSTAVFEFDFLNENQFIMTMTSPKPDRLFLKRAP